MPPRAVYVFLSVLLFACADDDSPPGEGSDSASGDSATDGSTYSECAETARTADGRLALRCDLPRTVDACQGSSAADCEDADGDGLVDAWEDIALELLRPRRRFDEKEQYFDDPMGVLGDVGRVTPAGERIRIFVMLGYSRDYGSCSGFTSHNGDSERLVIDLQPWPEGGAGGVAFTRVYTAAHEGTLTDGSRTFAGEDLSQLVVQPDPESQQPRWYVYPSAGKHATYATVEICESVSDVNCFDEDCNADGVPNPAAFDVLPPVVNAGEPDAPRVDDLTELGFAGETAWREAPFCGGLGGNDCPPSVREKLLTDPFQ